MEQNKQSAPPERRIGSGSTASEAGRLKAAGHDSFTITKCKQDAFSADLKEEYKDLPAEESNT